MDEVGSGGTRGAIQYSLEKYPEKYHKLVVIFVILFKMFQY